MEMGDGACTYDEDPSPSRESGQAVHLHQAICEDTSESRCAGTDQVECRVAFLELEAGVPGRHEVYAAGEETSLENTENDAQSNHLSPVLDESKGLPCVLVMVRLPIGRMVELTIMMPPQRSVMAARNMRGPIFRMMTVAGGWQMTYGMKKMRVMTLYRSMPVALNWRSLLILTAC